MRIRDGAGVQRRLAFRPPFDWPTALRVIGAHAVPGSEVIDTVAGSITRLLPGPAGPVAVTVRSEADHLVASAEGDDADLAAVEPLLRCWLDLDLDPKPVWAVLARDPRLRPLVTARPGLRRIGYPDPFEAVQLPILGQQVSLAAGRTFASRLVQAYGAPGPAGLIAFPRPERVAGLTPEDLQRAVGVTEARARTLLAVARLFVEEPVLFAGFSTPERGDDISLRLSGLPGVGPWTVQYLRMRLLGDPDALPASDLVLRRALGVRDPREVTALAEGWRPWRSYAVFQLWASTAW